MTGIRAVLAGCYQARRHSVPPLTEPGAGFILFTIKMNGHLFFIIV